MSRKSKSTPQVIDQNLKPKRTMIDSMLDDLSPDSPIASLEPPEETNRAEMALRRLDIDPEELELMPKVSDSIAACFGKDQRFPREKVVNLLAGSTVPAARAFIDTWKKIPKRDWDSLPFEAVCLKAQVSPLEIFGLIVVTARDISRQQAALKAILAHPDVVEATINMATKGTPVLVNGEPVMDAEGNPLMMGYGDLAAQRVLHSAVGFITTKSEPNTVINLQNNVASTAQTTTEVQKEEQAWMNSFPQISASLENWSERRRQLGDGK